MQCEEHGSTHLSWVRVLAARGGAHGLGTEEFLET